MHPGQLNPSRYGYQGEYAEQDEEINQNFFQLRMYDPVVGRWNSMDPKGEFPSPYLAMGNNPVINVDPDGGNIWKPSIDENGNAIMIKEEGDNLQTLERDYGKDMANLYKDKVGGLKEGESFKLDRGFTGNVFAAWQNRDKGFYTIGEGQYNCFECAISYSQGREPEFGPMYETEFESNLKSDYYQSGRMIPRKTVLAMVDKNGEYIHAAVFFGYDKNRNAYYVTKNGDNDLSIQSYKSMNKIYTPLGFSKMEFWNLKNK